MVCVHYILLVITTTKIKQRNDKHYHFIIRKYNHLQEKPLISLFIKLSPILHLQWKAQNSNFHIYFTCNFVSVRMFCSLLFNLCFHFIFQPFLQTKKWKTKWLVVILLFLLLLLLHKSLQHEIIVINIRTLICYEYEEYIYIKYLFENKNREWYDVDVEIGL